MGTIEFLREILREMDSDSAEVMITENAKDYKRIFYVMEEIHERASPKCR